MLKIKKALLSVSNKDGIVALAKALVANGCELISTGGTGKVLKENGIGFTEISKVTGNPEAFSGRMKTISFEIESAILFHRDNDAKEASDLGIEAIDMVICNLYPFKNYRDENADLDTLVENIDIGGPTMIRAAAKNYKFVACLTDPAQYENIIFELNKNAGSLSLETKEKLARLAFNHTADYDSMIAETLDQRFGVYSKRLSFSKGMKLRYGENPHQEAMFYKQNDFENSLFDMEILGGKELSYNNIVDIDGAIYACKDLDRFGCAIIKHTNPCGLCEGDDQLEVFEKAWASDPVSAFGSIIAFNKPLKLETAKFLELDHEDKFKRKFVEVIIAPSYADETLEYLKLHKGLRIIKLDPLSSNMKADYKFLNGTLLLQDSDNELLKDLTLVTKRECDILTKEFIEFGLKACRSVKSNAIVVIRKFKNNNYFQLLGIGAGQPNRVNSVRLSLDRMLENLKNEFTGPETEFEAYKKEELERIVLISDAFFPFPDNIEIMNEYGIKTVVQPGGSIKDRAVIKKCDELGISMFMTGMRHFRH
ncbi:MAG: bifunctional phosphoribosylaminoimidazolecarboxamide formyltransferase/IMP cyclohydrolase [Pseudomonadota bacterium]